MSSLPFRLMLQTHKYVLTHLFFFMFTVSKGNHLWEFIRDLLKDPKSNPHLLRWEEKETGVFRFVQSEAVAQMWGRKKNNPGMTYEKLSRAMR